jgi:hypothetical protein
MGQVQYVAPGINAFNAVSVGGTPTSEQMFPSVINNFTSAVNPGTAFPAIVGLPANGQFEMQRFTVKASGKVTLGSTSSPTLIWKLYNGTSMTASSNGTALLTMSALTGLTVSKTYPWSLIADFQGDSTSGILQAINATIWVDNATAGTITLTGIASGLNFQTYGPVNLSGPGYTQTNAYSTNALNLCLSCTFGVASATNKCFLSQFWVES